MNDEVDKNLCADYSGSLNYGYRCFEDLANGITCDKHAKRNLHPNDKLVLYTEIVKTLTQLLKNPGTTIYHNKFPREKRSLPRNGIKLENRLYKLLRQIDIMDLTNNES